MSQFSKPPLRVLVTGAAGKIAYSLIPIVAHGDVFGRDQPVILHFMEHSHPVMSRVMEGVAMELMDSAFPLVVGHVSTVDEAVAFKDIDAAFLIGSMPRRQGMERKDLLAANVEIFASQGHALAAYAKPTAKVLVVGNPANTNALVTTKFAAPKIPARNITAMSRLDHNRLQAQVALRNNVSVTSVSRVAIWGNHSGTQFPDVTSTHINGQPIPLKGHDDALITLIQKRGAAVISARKLSSAASAAKAATDHMRDWWNGSRGEWVSMCVISDGNSYGIPNDLIFSFPVIVDPATREWKIVDGVQHDDVCKERIRVTTQELVEERAEALTVTGHA